MSTCTSNTALGLIGCDATYTGRRQHSVARVTWSDHPDGRAHVENPHHFHRRSPQSDETDPSAIQVPEGLF